MHSEFLTLAQRYCPVRYSLHKQSELLGHDEVDFETSTLGDVSRYIKDGVVVGTDYYDLADEIMLLLIMHVAFGNVKGNLKKLLYLSECSTSFMSDMARVYESFSNNCTNVDISDTDSKLIRDVFETVEEYEVRIKKMSAIEIASAIVKPINYDAYTKCAYIETSYYNYKNLHFDERILFVLPQKTPFNKIINGTVKSTIYLKDNKVVLDYSKTLLKTSDGKEYPLTVLCSDKKSKMYNVTGKWVYIGTCVPNRESYNIDTKKINISVNLYDYFKTVTHNLTSFTCRLERDVAKGLCVENNELHLIARFTNDFMINRLQITNSYGGILADIDLEKEKELNEAEENDVYLQHIDTSFKNKDYSGCLNYIKKWLYNHPHNASAHNYAGVCMSYMDNYSSNDCLKEYIQAVQLDPTNAQYNSNVALMYCGLKQYNKAYDFFEKAFKYGLDKYRISLSEAESIAEVNNAEENYKKAAEFYRIAAEKSDDKTREAQNYSSSGLCWLKVYEQVNNDIYYKQVALYNFEKALEADPNNSVAKEYVKKLKPKKGLFSFFQ